MPTQFAVCNKRKDSYGKMEPVLYLMIGLLSVFTGDTARSSVSFSDKIWVLPELPESTEENRYSRFHPPLRNTLG